ncbi:MAG: hypothetical protein GWM92_07615, partial [Gemmatimonadetes bacterium]|nr:hypothetical protein [Gemmatimonadota bacterium]NIR78484.1 hypothetical protein [Gemmatimonadota bacterium]NIT87099.1 hypothetical protein [Gemmatimonadota bacterium]NIU30941.1 hypothetical protein [Gemmatimonadota bacterium]NIU35702.1 hypothetical protein [Gemmatimonadota bacterium]
GWYRDSLFHRVATTRETDSMTVELEWTRDGRVRLRMLAPAEDSIQMSGAPGEELSLAGITLVPRPWREEMPRTVEVRVLPFGVALQRMEASIEPERTRREANVVALRYDHEDPGVARGVVEALSRGFVRLRAELFRRESGETVDSLRTVARDTRAELTAAEDAVVQLQRDVRLIAPEVQSEVFVERYGEILGELEEARLELRAIENLIDRVAAADDPASAWTELAAFPRFLEHQSVGLFLNRLTDLAARRTELATRRTQENREMRVLSRQIQDLDASLHSMATGYRAALREQIDGLEAKIAEMDATMASMPADAVELARRQREVEGLSRVLVETELRLRQEEIREALTFANVQVVDPPALRHRPVWPRKKLGAAVGLLLAGGLGLLGMVVRDRADQTVRREGQVREVLSVPVLAALVRGKRGVALSDPERRVLLKAADRGGSPGAPICIAGVGAGDDAEAVARSLAGQGEPGDGSPGAGTVREVTVLSRLVSPGDAEDLSDGRPTILVTAFARTALDELARAGARAREAGSALAGVVVVCRRDREREEVWS